jgi:hypothetical protein
MGFTYSEMGLQGPTGSTGPVATDYEYHLSEHVGCSGVYQTVLSIPVEADTYEIHGQLVVQNPGGYTVQFAVPYGVGQSLLEMYEAGGEFVTGAVNSANLLEGSTGVGNALVAVAGYATFPTPGSLDLQLKAATGVAAMLIGSHLIVKPV